jgi:hypothetical protein
MSHQPSPRARRATFALVLGALVATAAGACSSSQDPPMPDDISTVTLPPPTDGANCTDPKGDISDTAQQIAGTLSEPSGVDLVGAQAEISDTDMTIRLTSAGPIADAPEPIFYVSQGPSGLEASFELRIQPSPSTGVWSAGLITWAEEGGRVQESDPRPLGVPVTVDGNQLSFTVPLTELPKIVTMVWQFGASAKLPPAPGTTTRKTVLDDCNNMSDQTGPGSSVPTTEGGPTTTVASGVLDTPLVSNDGVTVTVFAYQNPPTQLEPLEVPPEAGYVVAVVEAEVCAGETDTTIHPQNFRLLTSENKLWEPWDAPQTARSPALPGPGTLPAGECRRGWITYEIPSDVTITDVVFTPDSGADGSGTLLWSV